LYENGCPMNDSTTFHAAKKGRLDCLKYAYENGCEITEQTRDVAEQNDHLDCLEYILDLKLF
jgi:hypothetical protein